MNFYDLAMYSQIKKPSLASDKPIYFQGPPQLEQATRPNLEKKVSEVLNSSSTINVTSTSLPFSLNLSVTFV